MLEFMPKQLPILYANTKAVAKQYSLRQLLAFLPAVLEERALRYHFEQDAYNFVVGRLLLLEGLDRLGKDRKLLGEVVLSETGKPTLEGFYFNISHSQHIVVCSFSEEVVMGIDVEFPREINRTHFRHCFSEQEQQLIEADASMQTFYRYWTSKEAVLKANGMGLDRLLDMQIDGQEAIIDGKSWHLQTFDIPKETAYATVCTDKAVELLVEKWKMENLSNA